MLAMAACASADDGVNVVCACRSGCKNVGVTARFLANGFPSYAYCPKRREYAMSIGSGRPGMTPTKTVRVVECTRRLTTMKFGHSLSVYQAVSITVNGQHVPESTFRVRCQNPKPNPNGI